MRREKAAVLRALRRHVFEPLDSLPHDPLADEFVERLAGAERVTDDLRDGRVPVAERDEPEQRHDDRHADRRR